MNDPFGLKKLDGDLGKIFKSEPKKESRQTRKTKNDAKTVKEAAEYTAKTVKYLHKLATRNQIPKDYDGIMAMRDRLELEQKQRYEMERARSDIKRLLRQRKIEDRLKRRQKINRIVKLVTLKRNNTDSEKDQPCE